MIDLLWLLHSDLKFYLLDSFHLDDLVLSLQLSRDCKSILTWWINAKLISAFSMNLIPEGLYKEYKPDISLTNFLLCFPDCVVQSNETSWQTMLSFFGPMNRIQEAVQNLRFLIPNGQFKKDEHGKLFITGSIKEIGCECLYTNTLQDALLDPNDIKLYYDGKNSYHNRVVAKNHGTCSFGYGSKMITPERWISDLRLKSYFWKLDMLSNQLVIEKSFLHRANLFTYRDDIKLKQQNNKILVNNLHLQTYFDQLILLLKKHAIYILSECANYEIMNSDDLNQILFRLRWKRGYTVEIKLTLNIKMINLGQILIEKPVCDVN